MLQSVPDTICQNKSVSARVEAAPQEILMGMNRKTGTSRLELLCTERDASQAARRAAIKISSTIKTMVLARCDGLRGRSVCGNSVHDPVSRLRDKKTGLLYEQGFQAAPDQVIEGLFRAGTDTGMAERTGIVFAEIRSQFFQCAV